MNPLNLLYIGGVRVRKRAPEVTSMVPLMNIDRNPDPAETPVGIRLACWLVRRAVRRNELSESYAASAIFNISFQVSKDIAARFKERTRGN